MRKDSCGLFGDIVFQTKTRPSLGMDESILLLCVQLPFLRQSVNKPTIIEDLFWSSLFGGLEPDQAVSGYRAWILSHV